MKKTVGTGLLAADKLSLRLFVSGMSLKSMAAITNVRNFCDKQWKGSFELEIIDIYKDPEAARENEVVFFPSLIKDFPLPKRTLIGDLADPEKVITALGITK